MTVKSRHGNHQIHVDVAERACGDRDVLWRYLDMAMYFGRLAVQASPSPGSYVSGQSFPYIPEGDEAVGCPHARVGVGGPMLDGSLPEVGTSYRIPIF
jgi:hypothetical protein